MVAEKSLTKDFYQKGDGRNDERYRRTEGRTDLNQYTPTFSKRGYILFLKDERKENLKNSGKNKQKKTGSQSHDTTMHHEPGYQI